ncbi:helix-hairpin-helix domain-containing protein [Micromonospora globbae]|uniref:helix-hairpin-helix domain-containing protein n=1 Tax=Micromonospora globbae TaxID=1894969 RepID=UPI0034211466
MSSAPDHGWHQPVPGPSVTLGWRVLHSWWLLLPLLGFGCLGGFGFLYVGIRTRRAAWWVPGIVYTVLGWGSFILVGESDQESAVSDWAVGLLLAVWAGGILHAALINSSWLRWRAGHRPWYQQPTAVPWPGGPYPPGTLAPPPGAAFPAGPAAVAPTSGGYAPVSPGYPPVVSPAYPPVAGTNPPPADPTYAYGAPPADPTLAAHPGGYFAAGPVAAPVPPAAPPPVPSQQRPTNPLDVNAAEPHELASLPGFDAARAAQVVGERERRGGFGSLAEFAAAANLAPHEYARLRDVLVCAPPAPPAPGQLPHGRVLDV